MKTILVVLAASNALASGRIGETAEQLERRYGKPVRTTHNSNYYEKDGISITTVMWKDRCHLIHFSPVISPQDNTKNFGMNRGKLTKEQIQSFLTDNPAGVKWEGTEGSFTSSDHKFTALASSNGVVIQTVSFLNHAPQGTAPRRLPIAIR
ncbi:hypothetical protein OKA05_21380 [Luteolibacter arcticus]|uniref:Uncharacterized protein n=1 Tax=Luteolibacter arcticus TaxID=1581411 RepID=A0ABT3GNQ3_9BACT|nr:hypothetical protein [Luteolibacter arcticus]MCW1925127.1 hypothetical protein [Luteolibacter arcticus]